MEDFTERNRAAAMAAGWSFAATGGGCTALELRGASRYAWISDNVDGTGIDADPDAKGWLLGIYESGADHGEPLDSFDGLTLAEAMTMGRAALGLTLDPDDAALVARVGDRFAELLKADIGDAKYEMVRQRNATDKYAGACASHDFCDANMVMRAAVVEVLDLPGNDWCIDGEDERQCAFWGKAWKHAIAAHLTVPEA